MDKLTLSLVGGIFAFLALASGIGFVLGRRALAPGTSDKQRATVDNLNARLRAWWVIVGLCVAALWLGRVGACVLFGLASFRALREFVTLTPTRAGDHRALFWVFFVVTPLQYYLIAIQWYGLFVILIPVYAFLFIPMRMSLTGDCEHFLERAAGTQWGLMICVYCVSYAPALMTLPFGPGRWLAGGDRAAVLPAGGAVERRVAVHLGQVARKTSHRAARESQQDVGRLPRRGG